MTTCVYELPTTGSVSFSSFLVDITEDHAFTSRIAEATQARANLRAVLKQSRRTDGEQRDYLRIIKVRPPAPIMVLRPMTHSTAPR